MGLDIFGAYDIIRVENKNSSFKSKYGKSSPEANWAKIFLLSLSLTRFVKEASGFAAGARSFIEKIKSSRKEESRMAEYFLCKSMTVDSNLGKLILDVNSTHGFPTAEQALRSVTQLPNPHGWRLVRVADVSVKVTAQAEPEPEEEK